MQMQMKQRNIKVKKLFLQITKIKILSRQQPPQLLIVSYSPVDPQYKHHIKNLTT